RAVVHIAQAGNNVGERAAPVVAVDLGTTAPVDQDVEVAVAVVVTPSRIRGARSQDAGADVGEAGDSEALLGGERGPREGAVQSLHAPVVDRGRQPQGPRQPLLRIAELDHSAITGGR